VNRFEIDFLDDYSEETLLAEVRRVAADYRGATLSTAAFEELSGRVSASTVRRKLGGWEAALEAAGFGHLYGGPRVSSKMKAQAARRMTNDDLVAEMRRVRKRVGRGVLTSKDFDRYSLVVSSSVIRGRFGSWEKALGAAGIPQSIMANRNWTDEDCFENLAGVWTQLGRQPTYREMFEPPSTINGKAYETRWGTWRKALKAFVAWADVAADANRSAPPPDDDVPTQEQTPARPRPQEVRRSVGARLRFQVFQRDRFRCVVCGRSPATNLSVVLHADHVVPFALDGRTTLANLQTLCQDCNLGKGTMAG